VGENGGKFKINQTKAPVRLPVSHVAYVRVVMAHAEWLKLGEQFPRAFRVQMFHAAAAVCSDDLEFPGIGFKQPWNESAAARFKMAQNAHLVGESRLRVWFVIGLEHPSIEAQMDGCTQSIFGFQHTTGSGLFLVSDSIITDLISDAKPVCRMKKRIKLNSAAKFQQTISRLPVCE